MLNRLLGAAALLLALVPGLGLANSQTAKAQAVQPFCAIYPIAISDSVVAPLPAGSRVSQMPRGTGPGNYSWLTWSGANNAPTLAASLVPPGDSDTYRNPDDAGDRVLNIGDFAQGAPGSMNASAVRSNLEALRGRDIIVPAWDSRRGQGSKFDYRVKRFITIRLQDWRLTGNGWLTFDYVGEATCYNVAPVALPQTLTTPEDTALPVVLAGTDEDGDALAYSIVSAPSHGSIEGSGQQITYVPAADYHGVDSFTFKVNDGLLDSAPATVQITVTPLNDPPTADDQQLSTPEDTALAITLTGADIDGDALEFILESQPSSGVLSGQLPSLVYLPSRDYNGRDSFTFRTRDGSSQSGLATVEIEVLPVNDPPHADDQSVHTEEDTPVAITLSAGDPDGDPLSFLLDSQPRHGSLSGQLPNLTYTPAADYHGSDSFTFHSRDGERDSNIATVSITVAPVNDAPRAIDQQLQTDEDVALDILLTGADPEGDALVFHVGTSPEHGTLTGQPPNLVYTPAADFSGDDRFTFRVNDGQADSDPATVSIVVRPVNDPPLAIAQTVETAEEQPVSITLGGSDPDGDAISFALVTQPTHGVLSGAGPDLTYTPAPDFHGADSFTFVTRDGELESTPATVSITVTPLNDPPSANDQTLQTQEDTPLTIVLTGADPDGDVLAFTVRAAPEHGALNGVPPNLVYTPAPDFHGEDRFTFTSRDAELESSAATVSITVLPVNDPPIAVPQQLTTNRDQPVAITLAGSDPEGAAVSFHVVVPPAHGALTGEGAQLTYTPNPGFFGNDQFDFRTRDGELDSSPATVAITVLKNNAGPQIVSVPPASIEEGGLYRYDVDATDPDGDTLEYGLLRSPGPATLSSQTGQLEWQAAAQFTGTVRARNSMCRTPSGPGLFDPVVAWTWDGPAASSPQGNVFGPVLVGQFTDDNQDGRVDAADRPDVVVMSYGTQRYLNLLDGRSGQTHWSVRLDTIAAYGTPAFGDLDGDGRPEIVAEFGEDAEEIRAFSATGAQLWRRTVPSRNVLSKGSRDAIALADLEGDGQVEIIRGPTILESDGRLRCHGTRDGGGPTNYGWIPSIGDIDGDGIQEIVAGRTIYSPTCAVKGQLSAPADGFTALGNFDDDPEAEIVLVSNGSFNSTGKLYVFNHDGSRVFGPISFPGGGTLGPPTLANVDDDPYPEIGIAGKTHYAVFDHTGAQLWAQPVQDESSNQTGSTSFDFESDGRAELVYSDELNLRVFDGRTGEVRLILPNTSGTTLEYPVIADVDADGSADILIGANGAMKGVRMLSSATRSWAPTRSIWNQHGYHVDNISDDGRIPARPAKSWLSHNTYRLNTFPDRVATGLADLALFDLQLVEGDPARITVEVFNRGMAPTANAAQLRIFAGRSAASGRLLGTLDVEPLSAGERRTLDIDLSEPPALGDDLFVDIDAAGDVTECIDSNNVTSAALFTVRATDPDGLFDTQRFSVTVEDANSAPVLQTATLPDALINDAYRHTLAATDADIGDALRYELVSAPPGMAVDPVSGELRWTSGQSQSGQHQVTIRVADLRGLSDQKTLTIRVAQNRPPEIVSAPVTAATEGQRYEYDVEATDSDNDVLGFALLNAPSGMSIDPQSGLITWVPEARHLGEQGVVVSVNDGRGGTAEQAFTIVVAPSSSNRPPVITSAAPGEVTPGATFVYQLTAEDPDGDPLSFLLVSGPAGMSVAPDTGRVEWMAPADLSGSTAVTLRVEDGRGGSAEQRFTLQVGGSGNRPPSFISTPPGAVTVGETFVYAIEATDPDGDVLTLRMPVAPSGMSLNEASGEIRWVPTSAQLGTHEVRIEADDYRGGVAYQTFTIVVNAAQGNRAPRIDSTPSTVGKVGKQYRYQLIASDPDGDALTASLTAAPAGMTLAPSGLITWTPTAAGTFNAAVRVSDGRGYSEQSWSIVVMAASVPLAAQVSIAPDPVDPGAQYTLTVQTSGAAGPVQTTATLDGQPLTLDADGQTTLTAPGSVGRYTIEVTVTDGYDTVTLSRRLNVGVPADTQAPTAVILSPREGAQEDLLIVTAPQDVTIRVQDEELSHWVLGLVERGDASGSFVQIGTGEANVDGAVVGRLDPTLLQNGMYQLVLQAEDQSGNFTQDQVLLSVEGAMKLGHFSISFADLQVPVAGLPITVTRTYDTRQRHKRMDFGYGWSVDYQSVRLQEARRPGFAWTIESRGGLGAPPNFCIASALGNVVSVTMPDGEVEKFRAKATPECSSGNRLDFELVFEPMEGTTGTLIALEDTAGRLQGGSLVRADGSATVIDPNRYLYTNAEGQDFTLDQGFTVREIHEHEGDNRVTFSFNGVVHSAGPSITFVRDAQGRITRVIAPDNSELRYEYNPQGDLAAVIDQNEGRTEFTYVDGHYLEDIYDPRGVRVSRNEYDDDGRLIAVVDADGHRIEYTRDIDGRVEQVKDRNGHTTTYVYNERGDVLAETNAENETTLRTYDENGNTLTETDPLSNTRIWTYDALGNVLTETDPEDGVTTNRFGPFNQLETVTDPLQRVVQELHYRNRFAGGQPILPGPLIRIEDANDLSTSFGYSDLNGELNAIVDPTGARTRFETDEKGFKTAEIDAEGARTDYVNDAMGRVLEERRYRTLPDGSTQTLLTVYTLDAKGNVTAVTHPDGSVTTTAYDGNDKPIRECDGLNRCTVSTYDDRGNLVSTTYPDDSVESKTYDANGNLLSETDRSGATTRFVYDRANRLIETIYPDDTPGDADNPRTRSVYDDAGRLVESIDERGAVTRYAYDRAGRRIRTELPQVDGTVDVISDEYDLAGRRIASTDAEGVRTEYDYDPGGRLVETRVAGTPMRVEYDRAGRKAAEVDAENRRTEYAYDKVGRLVQVTLAAGTAEATVTTYAYDRLGNKIAQTDAEGRTTRWEYDAMGRETARILPLGQREEKRYNAAGELVEHTDFNGRTTRYEYDAIGQLERIDYPADHDPSFGYSPRGERIEALDARGASSTEYDARGRVLRSVDADGGIIEYQYDAAGNLIARISPHQSLVYGYDARNRLIEVTRSIDGEAPSTTRYDYDGNGRRIAMSGGDGTVTVYQYDSQGRLRDLIKRSAAGILLAAMSYQVDASGLRTAIEESDASGIVRTVDYAYDGLRRLVEERIDHRDDAHDRISTWTYDRVGNRLTQTVTAGVEPAVGISYTYDRNDRLETENRNGQPTAYTYDDNGNTLSKGGPDGLTQYRYDDANRLAEAVSPEGTTAYVYNVDGLRVRSTHTPTGGSPTTTWYLQDSAYPYAQVIEQHEGDTRGSKRLTATYAFADELIAQTRYDENSTPETAFVHMDGFGSTRWLTDEAGVITDSVDYDAFGVEIHRDGSTEVQHLYRGEAFDPNVGFYYLRARWYGLEQGRFLTQDSFVGFIHDPQSLHKYAYTHNSPVNSTDPSGHVTLMELGSNLNAMSNLYTVASTAFDLAAGNYVGAAEGVLDIVSSKFSFGASGVTKLSPRAEALFARVWSRGQKLKVTGVASSKTLADNLAVIGFPRPAGAQAHHLVGAVTSYGRRTRDMLANKFSIDVNSPLNGVWLPDCKGPVGVMTIHCGKHTEAYELLVFNELSKATTRDDAIRVLADIRRQLITGELPLNSRGIVP
ncbi:Ig-like domain-containing protein [Pseudomarimonas salicorniae]|uniref:Ig-like domain-containing protein n=1 Tax=Pseudomarimonas salicorniae TaxID=2933270 RepID=A0ABT0GCN4_9GAMM|nr:Ig-like domain-containing protein [Lysobacter sp. CAU 1642]MCK7592298.1 Ig-like domain-containing protein [Lysobacter sp. CAU 1642]